jgi:O-antigen/teichoic acid export membrane protein
METYGQYKEFIIYSSLILTFISFSVQGNLIYFISKDPEREKNYVSNTFFLVFFFHLAGLIVVFILQNYIRGITTFDFFLLLLVYIFITQYLDLLENYWLAKKRMELVLYWTVTNVLIRTGSIILVAYLTRDVISIIYIFIIHEFAKSVFTFLYMKRKKLLTWINIPLLKDQLVYIIPMGLSIVIFNFNNDISKVIISANLGASALAVYSIGSQNIPFLQIIRTSVTNVIFPEMAERTSKNPLDALILWNKSNLLYFFLMVPVFFVFFSYADVFIITLFTSQYSDAIILFRIYLIVMLSKCFEMSTPLRAMNKNKYFVIGNFLSMGVNIVMLYLLFKWLGIVGPAVAFVITEFTALTYLSFKIISTYNIKLSQMLLWKKLTIILIVGITCVPILFAGSYFNLNPVVTAISFGILYFLVYILIFKKLRIEEVDVFMEKVLKNVRLSW